MSSQPSPSERILPDEKLLVLFDGYCNLCNGAVQFIIKRDKKNKFFFASLSWPVANGIVNNHEELKDVDSIILWDGEKAYSKSSAALKIAEHLGSLWPLTKIFWVIPKALRDAIYDFVARNRYKWFGKKDYCMVPTPELTSKFLNEKKPA